MENRLTRFLQEHAAYLLDNLTGTLDILVPNSSYSQLVSSKILALQTSGLCLGGKHMPLAHTLETALSVLQAPAQDR